VASALLGATPMPRRERLLHPGAGLATAALDVPRASPTSAMETHGLAVFITLVASVIAACGDEPSGPPDAGLDAPAARCAGGDAVPYDCAWAPDGAACRGDAFLPPSCVDGAWSCPPGHIPDVDCNASSCLGVPLPGETCTPTGWQCTGGAESLPTTPDRHPQCGLTLCLTCAGFTGPFTVEGCTCSCRVSDGTVRCEPSP